MNTDNLTERAEANLERKLDWLSRFDNRMPFVTSVSIAMLGILANVAAKISVKDWSTLNIAVFSLSAACLLISLLFVYLCQYPKSLSPNQSLLYFGTISHLNFDDFRDRFKLMADDDYLNDLLSQTHILSLILAKKFSYLKTSLIFTLISIPPWILALYVSNFLNIRSSF